MQRRLATLAVTCAVMTACGTTVPAAQQSGLGQARLGDSSSLGSAGAPEGTAQGGTAPGAPGTTATSGGAPATGPATTVPGGNGSGAGSAAEGTTPGQGSSGTTAAKVTKPITIGFLNTGSTAALAAGFGKKGNTVTWQGTDEALIRYYNAHGGIAGRQIKPVFYTVQTSSSSFANDTQAACAKFTQDNHVDLVLTTAGTGSFDNYEHCLDKAKVVNLETYDQGNTDSGTFAAYPGLFTVGAPVIDHAITATLSGLARSGYLTRKNKIGVLVETCPYNVRAYERSYAPLAKKLGISVTRRDVGCVDNAGDLGTMLQQASTTVLPFRSAGIDRISFVSDFESVLMLGFSDQAESQGWRPGYALTSASHAAAYAPQLSQPQLPQMHGVGNLPNVDVTSRGALSEPTKRCRARLTSQGVTGSASGDYSILDTGCDVFSLLEAALTKTRGASTTAALITALHSLGTMRNSAAVLSTTQTYAAGQRDGAPPSAVFEYATSCACFRYRA